jgi:hypothetical protein
LAGVAVVGGTVFVFRPVVIVPAVVADAAVGAAVKSTLGQLVSELTLGIRTASTALTL